MHQSVPTVCVCVAAASRPSYRRFVAVSLGFVFVSHSFGCAPNIETSVVSPYEVAPFAHFAPFADAYIHTYVVAAQVIRIAGDTIIESHAHIVTTDVNWWVAPGVKAIFIAPTATLTRSKVCPRCFNFCLGRYLFGSCSFVFFMVACTTIFSRLSPLPLRDKSLYSHAHKINVLVLIVPRPTIEHRTSNIDHRPLRK